MPALNELNPRTDTPSQDDYYNITNREPIKSNTTVVSEEESEKKKVWSEFYSAIDHFLSGKEDSLISSVLNAFGPSKDSEKAQGIGIGLIMKGVWFAVRHPIHAYNLIKLARSPKVINDKEFQTELLKRESTTNFIDNIANKKFRGEYLEYYQAEPELIQKLKPVLKQNSPEVVDIIQNMQTTPLMIWVSQALDLVMSNQHKSLQEYIAQNPTALPKFIKSLIEKVDKLKTISDAYRFDTQILDLLNIVLKDPKRAHSMVKAFNDQNYINLTKEIIELLNDPKMEGLHEKVKEQAENELFSKLIKGILEQDIINLQNNMITTEQSLRLQADKFGINEEVINQFEQVIPVLLKSKEKAEQLKQVFDCFIDGDYIGLAKKLLETSKLNPDIQKYLSTNNQLIINVLNNAFVHIEGIKKYEAKGELYEITPHLLNHTDELIKILDIYQSKGFTNEQKYLEIAKQLLTLVDKDENIKNYFTDNRDAIVQVLDNIGRLKEYGLEGKLYDIAPELLKHTKELIEIINLNNENNYGEIGKKFLKLIQNNEKIKQYFSENKKKFKEIAEKIFEIKKFGIGDEVTDFFDILMKEENALKIQGLADMFEKKEWLQLIKSSCDLIEEDLNFKGFISANKKNFAKIITMALESMPKLKAYTLGADISDLASEIIKNPASIKALIEGYEKGKVAVVLAGAKFAYEKLADKEVRGALFNAVSEYASNTLGDDQKQKITDAVIYELQQAESKGVIEINKFLERRINSLQKQMPEHAEKIRSIMLKNTLFNAVNIFSVDLKKIEFKDTAFNNAQFGLVSFQDAKFNKASFNSTTLRNTDFQNVHFITTSFSGANIERVTLENSTIDSFTFKTMIQHLREGNIIFKKVKIVGDLSEIDLSGLKLNGADLSEVTAMKGVNLDNTDLSGAKLPEKQEILADTYHLSRAKLEGIETQINHDILSKQKENEREFIAIEEIASGIGDNLFGKDAQNGRKAEVLNILNHLQEITKEMKIDISVLNKKSLIGTLERGYFWNDSSGLTAIYYSASKTWAGILTGGTEISEKVFTLEVKQQIKGFLAKEVQTSHDQGRGRG